jgi:hypothetical protein
LQTTLKKRPKTEKRGTSDEYMTTVDDVDITSLIWKDNKYVTLLSPYAGSLGVKLPIAYAMLLSTLLLNEADQAAFTKNWKPKGVEGTLNMFPVKKYELIRWDIGQYLQKSELHVNFQKTKASQTQFVKNVA